MVETINWLESLESFITISKFQLDNKLKLNRRGKALGFTLHHTLLNSNANYT